VLYLLVRRTSKWGGISVHDRHEPLRAVPGVAHPPPGNNNSNYNNKFVFSSLVVAPSPLPCLLQVRVAALHTPRQLSRSGSNSCKRDVSPANSGERHQRAPRGRERDSQLSTPSSFYRGGRSVLSPISSPSRSRCAFMVGCGWCKQGSQYHLSEPGKQSRPISQCRQPQRLLLWARAKGLANPRAGSGQYVSQPP
jgi:hypothetical protein